MLETYNVDGPFLKMCIELNKFTDKMAPGGGFEPPRPERPQADWCALKASFPGLLPARLGYPGK